MKRRNFLKNTGITAALSPFLLNGLNVQALASAALSVALPPETDRILVLIQLNGGNDGLNTIIPLDQYSNLSNARSNILVPESEVLSLTTETGIHPSWGGIKNLYEDGKVAVVQSVGYPNPNFSHFRSTDIWTSASDADEFVATGWLGRYLSLEHDDFPNGYPNDSNPDPLAITLGSLVSTTCQGTVANYSIAINNASDFATLLTDGTDESPDGYYGHELDYIRQSMLQTNQYTTVIQDAYGMGGNLSTLYPEAGENSLATQLQTIARLINGGLQTKIYIANIGGFDTHANQVVAGDTAIGPHADLLAQINEAIVAFQDDLSLMGREDEVIGMTFSEFGRRIASNDSWGTDHGAAAPLVVFGTKVNAEIFGANPEIPSEVEVQANVPMQFDFRSVYGSILMDWFGVAESVIHDILFPDFQYIPILQNTGTAVEDWNLQQPELLYQNRPNPFRHSTKIHFQSLGGYLELSLYSGAGQKLKTLVKGNYPVGKHSIILDAHHLRSGTYYCRLQQSNYQQVKMMVCVP